MKNKFNDAKIRVAIIAYRSFLDKDGEFKISNFTTNMSEIRSFLNNLNPTEDTIANEDVLDVLGSIDKSLSLDWQAANKLLFQIGIRRNTLSSDNIFLRLIMLHSHNHSNLRIIIS